MITNDSHLPSIQKIFSPGQGRLDEPQLSEIILELSENLHIIPGELRTILWKEKQRVEQQNRDI